jgi:acyl carrier protein
MNDTEQKIKDLVIEKLADHIGVEKEDINLDDSFIDDLHLNTAEITDFLQKLSENEIEIDESEFDSIETVSDLIEYILSQPGVI